MMRQSLSKVGAFLAGLFLSLPSAGFASTVDIADSPLFVTSTADPNLLFLLDDSGSMRWGFMPDELSSNFNIVFTNNPTGNQCSYQSRGTYAGNRTTYCSITGRQYLASNHLNKMYYDPGITYSRPFRANGTRYPNANFNSAYVDGYAESGSTIDLRDNYRAIMDDYFYLGYWVGDNLYGGFTVGSTVTSGNSGQSAFYYVVDSSDSCQGSQTDGCYSRVDVGANSSEAQNFANWFSYYRTRVLASRAGITAAFIDQTENMRLGWGTINTEGAVVESLRPFSGTHRAGFFNWLQSVEPDGSTPLPRALRNAGEYYSKELSDEENPWRTELGSSQADYIECRQSFTILMTDGYWNSNLSTDEEVGNQDGTAGSTITGPGEKSYSYEPSDPYQSDNENTLADVAMAYWKNDIQPDIENRVPATLDNPAFWQHMVTFGVGLGVSGSVEPEDAWNAMEKETAISWANPVDGANSSKIDDLLHAAVNSRGSFFSASSSNEFATELGSLLGQLAEMVGSASGITFDTATLEEDSLMFSARFDSSRWQGDIDARPLIFSPGDSAPTVGAPVWSAAELLDGKTNAEMTDRVILTYDPADRIGTPFLWSGLTESQKDDLRFGGGTELEREERGEQRLAFLRGDRSREGDEFRARGSRLGDIVHSTPVRVSRPAVGWPDTARFGADGKRYSDFRAAKADRTPILYVGANDGMLHGFVATEAGGQEVMAYVPSLVYSDQPARGLHHLTSSTYGHRYYVDLTPTVSDVYTRGRLATGAATTDRDWRTVLLGGLRSGGAGIFALDVTDPSAYSQANASQVALWEFTHPKLGVVTQPPQVALADWGGGDHRWTAFVANGYNSQTASTGFFMLDIEGLINTAPSEGNGTGDNYQYIEFDAAGTGLSPLSLYDVTGDRTVDRVYAGDLAGRVWASEGANQGWRSAYRGAAQSPLPLFTAPAVGSPAERQSITSAPMIIRNAGQKPPGGSPDTYVVVGTGRYMGVNDLTNARQQALYAIRDTGTSEVTVDQLAQRSLVNYPDYEGSGVDALLSEPSTGGAANDDRGWYVNLYESGERIYLTPQVRGRYIFAVSIIPSSNPCISGGESRIMVFGLDGLTPDRPVLTAVDVPVTSYKKIDGVANPFAFLGNFMFTPTSGGGDPDIEGVDVGDVLEGLGRQGWQELIE